MSDEYVKGACRICRYWDPINGVREDASVGACRRYAPRAPNPVQWPETAATDWCGDGRLIDNAREVRDG